MRAINRVVKISPTAQIAAVSAHMNNKHSAEFDDIRAAVPLVSGHSDAELEQVLLDADLTIER